MRTRLTLLCLFINFILVGCAGMPIMGKQSIPVPKSQSLADQEFKKQNKESAIHSQESTIKLASVDISVEKAMAQDLLQIRQPYQLLAKGRQQKEQPMSLKWNAEQLKKLRTERSTNVIFSLLRLKKQLMTN